MEQLKKNFYELRIDAYLVISQNGIDYLGRQYSPLRNFMLTGPLGLVLGEMEREKGTYIPSFMLALHYGTQAFMIGKSSCMVGFDLDLIRSDTNKAIASKNVVLGKKEIENDIWPDGITEYSQLDDMRIKSLCFEALTDAIKKSLID